MEPTYTLALSTEQINAILAALAKKPLEEVLAVFMAIQTQVQGQNQARVQAEEEKGLRIAKVASAAVSGPIINGEDLEIPPHLDRRPEAKAN